MKKIKNKITKANKDKKEITKDMPIGDILEIVPEGAAVMFRYGLHCIGCHIASFESLEQGAKVHGLNDKQIKEMIDELNKIKKK